MKKMFYTALLASFFLLFLGQLSAQTGGVGINRGGSPPDPSALLDLNDSIGGVLFPRMSQAKRDAISNPANFLVILNTDTRCVEMYNSSKGEWQNMFCACDYPATPLVQPASNVGPSYFRANWQAVPGATAYYVDVARDSNFNYIIPGFHDLFVGSLNYADLENLNFCDSTLYYRVRAGISCGSSASSLAKAVTLSICVYCIRIGGNGNDYCRGIFATSDGGFMAAGSGQSAGKNKHFYARVASDKTLVWSTCVGGTGNDYAGECSSVAQTTDGGLVVGGYTSSGFIGGYTQSKFYATKINPNGTLAWTKVLGNNGSTSENGSCIAVAPDGGVVIGGNSSTNGWSSNTSNTSYVVAKLNAAGTLQWIKRIVVTGSYNYYCYLYGLAVAPDGSVIAVGYGYDVNNYDQNTYIVKWNSSGTFQWIRGYGANDPWEWVERGNAVTTDNSGNIYVAGTYNGSSLGVGYQSAYVLKLDPSGNKVWDQIVGAGGSETFNAITLDALGNVIAVGMTSSIGFGGSDVFVCKFDPSGNLLNSVALGNTGHEYGYAVSPAPAGSGYFIGGYTTFQTFGSADWYIAKVDNQLNGCCSVEVFPQAVSGGNIFTPSYNEGTVSSVTEATGGTTSSYGKLGIICM